MRETKMKSRLRIMTSSKFTLIASAIAAFYLLGFGLHAAKPSKSEAASAPQAAQKQFDTPKQAADALVQVAANFDVAAAKEILGPDSEDIVASAARFRTRTVQRNLQPGQKKKCPSRQRRKIRIRPLFW